MKAVRYHGKNKGYMLEEIERPEIENEDDVIIRVRAAGLCRTDIHILEGEFESTIRKIPFTMGHENAGIVESLGGGVTGLKEGDAVIVYPQVTCGRCRACRKGDDMRCEEGRFHGLDGTDGGFAEYMKTSKRNVIAVEDAERLIEYAPLADAGITAYHAVKKVSSIASITDNLLIIGAGGVGQIAIQLLKVMGFSNIIVLEKSESKIELLQRLGVKQSIVYDDDERVLSKIKSAVPEGFDLVFDFVGDDRTALISLKSLKSSGIYSIIGYGGMLRVPTMEIVAKELRLVGNLVGTFAEFQELVKIVDKHNIRIPIKSFKMEDFGQAIEELKHGTLLGRAIIEP
jgi:D-arabinose 1-dehydrogenase-like Zn-dependent alcohol dehydrogenase